MDTQTNVPGSRINTRINARINARSAARRAAALSWLLLAACATEPQPIEIRPEVQVPADGAGQGRALQVSVQDKRPGQKIGSTRMDSVAPELVAKGDLAAVVRSSLAAGLARRAFAPSVDPVPDGRELRVEILGLDFDIAERTTGSSTLLTRSALKAACVRDSQPQLERSYEGAARDQVIITAPNEATSSRYLSTAVSRSLNSLLADRQLIECLAR
jgi:uncharacterized lipoprotein YajG